MPQGAVGRLEHPRDDADDADVVELPGRRLLELGVRLATITIIRSPPSASLTSSIERGWPIASGSTVSGSRPSRAAAGRAPATGSGGPGRSADRRPRSRSRAAVLRRGDRDAALLRALAAQRQRDLEDAVLVARGRGVGVDVGAERDDAPERAVLDLDLLVEPPSACGGRRRPASRSSRPWISRRTSDGSTPGSSACTTARGGSPT
jgi:hypothetical protein